MHLVSQTEKTAEAHDQGAPAHRINVRARPVSYEQGFIHVQLHYVDFKDVGADVLAEWAIVMNDAFHLDGAFEHSRRCY